MKVTACEFVLLIANGNRRETTEDRNKIGHKWNAFFSKLPSAPSVARILVFHETFFLFLFRNYPGNSEKYTMNLKQLW